MITMNRRIFRGVGDPGYPRHETIESAGYKMAASGAYYRREMTRLIKGHGCTLCTEEFETDLPTDLKYPYVSPVCRCTLCRACVDGCVPVEKKGWTADCPLCAVPKAWNMRNLVPNRHVANLLHDMKRVVADEGKDEYHGGDCE